MKRKFKALGLVLMSVFAMSAIGASAASAAEFHAASAPVTLNGSQTGSHVFTTDLGTVTCTTATFSGVETNKTDTEVTLAPNYNNCTAFGFINVPIHENGCAYLFNANGTTNVECSGSNKITITAPFCTVTVGAQHLPSGMTYTSNASNTDVIAHTNVTGIDYNECGTNKTNGKYVGQTTVQGAGGVAVWYT